MLRKTFLFFLLFTSILGLHAQSLVENFTYSNDAVLTANNWNEHSGNGSNPILATNGLSFFDLNEPTAAAKLSGGGQDIHRSFQAINTGAVYTRLLVNIKSASSDGEYFFHLGPSSLGTEFRGRVFAKSENGSLKFGVSKSSSNPNYTTQNFEFGKTYLLVLKYTFNTGNNNDDAVDLAVLSSTADLASEGFMVSASLGESDAGNIGSVALRQGSNGKAATLILDEILLSDNWKAVTTLKTPASLDLNFPENLYAFDRNCRDQSVFQGSLVANKQDAQLNLWSTDTDKVTFSTDGKIWSNQLSFKSATGNYSESIFIKYKIAIDKDKQNIELKIDDFDANELLNKSIVFRKIELASDCSLSISDFKNLKENEVARVTGVVSASANEFGYFNYIQDAGNGLRINGDYKWLIGDSISFFGQKGIDNQEVVIQKDTCCDVFESIQNRGKGILKIYQTSIDNISQYEGRLVQIKNASLTDKNFVFLPNSNEKIADEKGTLETRVWSNTDLDGLAKPQEAGTWQGVVGRYGDKLQLFPRKREDVVGVQTFQFPPNSNPEKTFDLAAWNVEWFGSSGNGPYDDEKQFENVQKTLSDLNADAYVLTEVSSLDYFDRLVSSVPNYAGKCSPAVSGGFSDGEVQRVCLVYNKEVVSLKELRPLLKGTPVISNYPDGFDRFWASGRLPALFVCDVELNNVTKRLHIIGIHSRANRNTVEERELVYEMRKKDIEVLKDSLDLHFSAASIIIAGDFNDDLDESVVYDITESSYKPFVDDKNNWNMISKSLSDRGFKSYIGYDNVIDHIGISNELNNNYINESVFLALPFIDIPDYPNTTSDHLPVMARFLFNQSDPITSNDLLEVDSVLVFPNPTNGDLQIKVDPELKFESQLFNQMGILIFDSKGTKEQLEKKISRQLKKYGQGLYLLKLIIGNEAKTYKIVNQ
ncbi:Por secretion system C-terminal sorting domain-containing protein [Spirosomataceae bacterium TFI 002]|nr:Por secretion system C-terminal sorting domain-containing protein [Spirosomataceae bacterium TFI 002]